MHAFPSLWLTQVLPRTLQAYRPTAAEGGSFAVSGPWQRHTVAAAAAPSASWRLHSLLLPAHSECSLPPPLTLLVLGASICCCRPATPCRRQARRLLCSAQLAAEQSSKLDIDWDSLGFGLQHVGAVSGPSSNSPPVRVATAAELVAEAPGHACCVAGRPEVRSSRSNTLVPSLRVPPSIHPYRPCSWRAAAPPTASGAPASCSRTARCPCTPRRRPSTTGKPCLRG